jgi:hypothetical protein
MKQILGILCITLCSLICCLSSKAQTYEQTLEEDKKSQKLTEMYVKSAVVILPDSVYTILKDFAINNNRPINLVMKQQFLLKMIYNTNLSKEERLIACNNLIKQYSGIEPVGPIFLVNNMKTYLLSNNK